MQPISVGLRFLGLELKKKKTETYFRARAPLSKRCLKSGQACQTGCYWPMCEGVYTMKEQLCK